MSQSQTIAIPSFDEAVEAGSIVETGGYHQPGTPWGTPNCGCKLTTPKGAYRDVTVEMPDGRLVHFYHQSPVVVNEDVRYRISSCGWRTSTTKERINFYIPSGFNVRQRDYEWYVTGPDGVEHPFEDGMVIEVGRGLFDPAE